MISLTMKKLKFLVDLKNKRIMRIAAQMASSSSNEPRNFFVVDKFRLLPPDSAIKENYEKESAATIDRIHHKYVETMIRNIKKRELKKDLTEKKTLDAPVYCNQISRAVMAEPDNIELLKAFIARSRANAELQGEHYEQVDDIGTTYAELISEATATTTTTTTEDIPVVDIDEGQQQQQRESLTLRAASTLNSNPTTTTTTTTTTGSSADAPAADASATALIVDHDDAVDENKESN